MISTVSGHHHYSPSGLFLRYHKIVFLVLERHILNTVVKFRQYTMKTTGQKFILKDKRITDSFSIILSERKNEAADGMDNVH